MSIGQTAVVPRVMVIGDVAIDRYVYGEVTRISPEAPIPIVRELKLRSSPGCAGNVAANIAALEGEAILIGVVGRDLEASELDIAIRKAGGGISPNFIVDDTRPTTTKTRVLGADQQVVRIDRESSAPIDADVENKLIEAYEATIARCDVVVISDYAKGMLTDRLLRHVIDRTKASGKTVLVDPKRARLEAYAGATIIKPNRHELRAATGLACESDQEIEHAADGAAASTGAMILVTRSEEGMSLYRAGQRPVHQRSAAQEVFDVSGAGDTVSAVLAVSLAAGLDVVDAMRRANVAAGVAVGKRGTAAVALSELDRALDVSLGRSDSRIVDIEAALEQRERWRDEGLTCGFTNGCFDLIHPGHVSLVQQARANCDRLVVALNSDESVRRLKGPSRPLQSEAARAAVMASMRQVDLVVVFREDTPARLIDMLKPDVLVKGADYPEHEIVGGDMVKSWGGTVVRAWLVPLQSTTRLVQRSAIGANVAVVR